MSFTITKNVPADFPALTEPIPEAGVIRRTVNEQITTAVCDDVNCTPTQCKIVFDVEPSVGDKTTIDNIVAAHTGAEPTKGGLVFARLSSSVDQIPVDTNPVSIKYNTQDGIQGIIHSTSSQPGLLEIDRKGSYFVMAQPQVGKDTGSTKIDFNMFLQVNRGSGFVDDPRSNIKLTIKDPDVTDVIVSGFPIQLEKGDKIRMMQKVSAVGSGIGLRATAAVVGPPTVPATPSIIFAIFRTGRF